MAGRAIVTVGMLTVMALLTFVPWRAADKYWHFRGMRPDIRTLAAERSFGRALVLVRGARFNDFTSASVYNPLDLSADQPIYVWDRDAATRTEVVQAFSHWMSAPQLSVPVPPPPPGDDMSTGPIGPPPHHCAIFEIAP